MKHLICLVVITALLVIPCFSAKKKADDDIARTQEYIAATQKKGMEKVNALQAYVKKFPDTASRWTRLAIYSLAVEYFNNKEYAKAIKEGEKRLGLGNFGKGEEARLNLVIGNCYGIKGAGFSNKEKAIKFTKKAISVAKRDQAEDVLKTARDLLSKLEGSGEKAVPPLVKFKRTAAMEDYPGAIAIYKTLAADEKNDPKIRRMYAGVLLKDGKIDLALKEFNALYSAEKKAIVALRLGDIYSKKGKRNKKMLDSAVDYYLEAGLLYQKEGNTGNRDIAFKTAKVELGKKYDFNEKAKALERKLEQAKRKALRNKELVKKKKREKKKLERQKYKEYERIGLAPPPHLQRQIDDLQTEIDNLESGVSADLSAEIDKLEAERKRIGKELEELKTKAKKRLNT